MGYKSIVSIVTDMESDRPSLDAAIEMTRRQDAHLDVHCLGIDQSHYDAYAIGTSATVLQAGLAQAEEDAAELSKTVNGVLEDSGIYFAIQTGIVPRLGLTPYVAQAVRYADLFVTGKPYGSDRSQVQVAVVEAALFNGNVPVLVIPEGGALPAKFDNVVVGWNESAEAFAAVRRCLPVLQDADSVDIAIIDPPPHSPDRSDPGGGISEMLARHGVRAEVSVLARSMPRVSDVLLRHARDKDADLIVMGAYGHSRFREAILGGATRNMLQGADLPVMMAH